MSPSRTFSERARDVLAAILGPVTPEPTGEERASYLAPQMPTYLASTAIVPVVTPTSAAQSIAIRSTTDLIASLGSELPITVYTGKGRGDPKRREVPTPSNLEDPGGDGTGREDWGYRWFNSTLYAGNAFGDVIEQDPSGRVRTCDLFNPEQITATIERGRPRWFVNGREIEADDLIHWRVNPFAGRLLGLSPIEAHAVTIGVTLATTRFGRSFFAEGARPPGMLTSEQDLTAEDAAIAKARMMATMGSGEPLVLGKGVGWDAMQINNEEAQFLETAGYSEAQCCRIFGPGYAELLGYTTGQKMTYANIVDRRQDLLVLSLSRWLRRYERVLSIFTPPSQWVEVNRDALLEMTTKQRYEVHSIALKNQFKTINEVRDLENLPRVPWGYRPLANQAAPAPADDTEEDPSGDTAGA